MSEHENRSENRRRKGLNSIHRRTRRNHISTGNGQRELRIVSSIYSDDRSARINQFDFAGPGWFRYRIAIVFASTGAFGVGLAQLVTELVSR